MEKTMGREAASIRAGLRERASGLKAEVQALEKLPVMSRVGAGIGVAFKGLHLIADFVMHVTEEVGEEIDGKAEEVDPEAYQKFPYVPGAHE